ncbi:hypothetical protein EL18_02084 [Nitratireductor basaltis]|uniref:Uncharacterized protein n=2 Tax=Nitratireductor basaltis TaxID=472175 RepID=A0A084UDK6_9HYPH|nr:hypothetical protein EL18_02084 [Nitratireductor basaltis]
MADWRYTHPDFTKMEVGVDFADAKSDMLAIVQVNGGSIDPATLIVSTVGKRYARAQAFRALQSALASGELHLDMNMHYALPETDPGFKP